MVTHSCYHSVRCQCNLFPDVWFQFKSSLSFSVWSSVLEVWASRRYKAGIVFARTSQPMPGDHYYWLLLLRYLYGDHKTWPYISHSWEPSSHKHAKLQWSTSNHSGWLPLKSRRSWGHAYSRVYSCRASKAKCSRAFSLYLLEGGWDLQFKPPWRRPRREQTRRDSRATPWLSLRYHQMRISDLARTDDEKKNPWIR